MASASSLPPSSSLTPIQPRQSQRQRRRQRPPALSIPYTTDAVVAIADNCDGVPFLGTPYALNQPFDYPFPINSPPPDALLGPQKPASALPIASSIVSAPSLVPLSSDPLASLPSVVSGLVSNPGLNRRSRSISVDQPVFRHSRSNSSLVSARSKSLQSLLSRGSGSSSSSTHTPLSISPSKPPSLSSRNPSPNGCHWRMTLAMAPSVGVTPRRPKSLTLLANQATKLSANPLSSGSSHSSGIGSLSSLSITSIVDDKRIPPTLRSKLQQSGSLMVASHDALPKSTEASAHATPALKAHELPVHRATSRPAPVPLPKRARAHSHASSFLLPAPGPIPEPDESAFTTTTTTTTTTTPPSPTDSTRISRQSSIKKRVVKKTASLVELRLEGLKRAAASGKSSAGGKRTWTRARAQETAEASGDSSRRVISGALEAPNVIRNKATLHNP